MRIGIFGRGRLAQAVSTAAVAAGHEVAWMLGRGACAPLGRVDVAVDCSLPAAVTEHLDWALAAETPFVVGVTDIDARALAERAQGRIGLLIAPNFSLSVALMARLAAVLARYASVTPGFDPYVMEKHHAKKVDAPSGTAKLLANRMLSQLSNKHGTATPGAAALTAEELCVSSVRAGSGQHSWHVVGIDSADEAIELRHEARSLLPCGRGAVMAAAFLSVKRGLFTMDDVARSALEGVLGALE
ncbi:MAG: hypothetical protein EXS14_02080 [Planctomycetes bacterium]|nr:hypothetical protein [Planctomycetota bacterium]